jgi:hypothetical protein
MRRLITALALHACSPAPMSDASRARLAPAATDLPTSDLGISADPLLVDLDLTAPPPRAPTAARRPTCRRW